MKILNFVWKYKWLTLILLVGSVLRLTGLLSNPISLFSDEIDMGYQAYSLIKTGCDYSGHCLPIQFHSFSDVQPPIPIYFIALFHLLGVNLDLSIRLVSAVAGILGILTTYLLVESLISKKIFNLNLRGAGLASAFVLAILPWHLTYSRIAFSLPLLYLFFTLGLFMFCRYLIAEKNKYLYLSLVLLGLTPWVYNTAKMAILFYPVILLSIPGAFDKFKKVLSFKAGLVLMYIPVALMFLAGGTTARFDYISIFTDPTASPEVNYERLQDSGPMAAVGSSPSLVTKLLHNKPLWHGNNLVSNYFGLLSTDFLFVKGDPNLRHSPPNSGMLYRSLALVILVGFFFVAKSTQSRLLVFLGFLVLMSLSTSAITRDGGSHASRSFLLVLPLIFLIGAGITYLWQNSKISSILLVSIVILESIFFVHDYWSHYRFSSERVWSSGMKDLILSASKYPNTPVVISPKNEHPLIFYLYYNRFDPATFQTLSKTERVYNKVTNQNLDGNRIGDTNLFIAKLIDYKKKPENIPGAIYYLTKEEVDITGIKAEGKLGETITLPSGEPLYYKFEF